jgi:hypothetical protein
VQRWTKDEIRRRLPAMAMTRFQCGKCGLEATQIGSASRYVPSVDPDKWNQLCVMAAAARENGAPADPVSVNCPYLQLRTMRRESSP